MAIIHQGRNENQEKINSYLEKEIQNARRKAEKRSKAIKRKNRRMILIRLLLVLISIGLILLFALHPELVRDLTEKAYWYCEKLGDAIVNGLDKLPEAKVEDGVLLGLLKILLGFVVHMLSLLPVLLVWLLQISSKVSVPVLCFAIPGLVAFSNVKKLIRGRGREKKSSTFSTYDAERKILDTMPAELKILQAGLEGEDAALKLLSRLGDNCHVYTNLLIPYDGKTSETDLIVVAPHGVTIVEVKNYKDTLMGDWSDEHLWLSKDRGRENYTDQVYNPVRQVGTHVYRLSHYLREHGVDVWVNSCVLFVNYDVQLDEVEDEKNVLQTCPVFRCDEKQELFAYLGTPHPETDGSSVVPLLNRLIAQQTKG